MTTPLGFKWDLDSRDLYFEEGSPTIITDLSDNTEQRLIARLNSWTGDWFLDEREGIDYPNNIFSKPVNIPRIRATLTEAILRDEAVATVDDLQIDFDGVTRNMTIDVAATLTSGEVLEIENFILVENL